jgi:hypothetical protein
MQRVREFTSNPTHNNAAELKTRRGNIWKPTKKKKEEHYTNRTPKCSSKKRELEFD